MDRVANLTARNVIVAAYLCPSDSGSPLMPGNSYRANSGAGGHMGQNYLHPDSETGIASTFIGPISFASFRDGLSHTAAFSERSMGSETSPLRPSRDVWGMVTGQWGDADDLLIACRIAAHQGYNADGFSRSGDTWFWSGMSRTLYGHTQSPNGEVPDCLHAGIGMTTARSTHPGGVNAAMTDGSVRFVKSSIALPTWRAQDRATEAS